MKKTNEAIDMINAAETASKALSNLSEAAFLISMCMLFETYAKDAKKDAVEMAKVVANAVKEVNEEEGAY